MPDAAAIPKEGDPGVELGDHCCRTRPRKSRTTLFGARSGRWPWHYCEGSYGTHAVVRGAGFLLNNGWATALSPARPTRGYRTKANLIAPGKRMLVDDAHLSPERAPRALTGSPGGWTNQHGLGIVLGVTEFDRREAVDAPQMHHGGCPTARPRAGLDPAGDRHAAAEMGHAVKVQGRRVTHLHLGRSKAAWHWRQRPAERGFRRQVEIAADRRHIGVERGRVDSSDRARSQSCLYATAVGPFSVRSCPGSVPSVT